MRYTLAGCLMLAALPVKAQLLDCAALAAAPGTEPAGFAEACLGRATRDPMTTLKNLGTDTLPGYGIQINPTATFAPLGLYQFGLDDFAGATRIGTVEETASIYGLDFNPAGTKLFGARVLSRNAGSQLGTFNLTTGAYFPQGFIGSLPARDNVTGMAMHPRTGRTWVSTHDLLTNNPQLGEARLWRVDIAGPSSNAAIVGRMLPDELNPVFVDIAVNCEGEMYGHNLTDDSLYKINTTTGEATLIGPHGFDANFSQGMDFDNATGELYASIYTGGGANTFGTFNLETGAFTALADGASGQWKVALRNECAPKVIEPETLDGAWFASYSTGQGFTARYFADEGVLFMPWYTYSVEGGEETSEQRWYALFGDVGQDATEIELAIGQTLGGNFDAPPGVGAVQVGTAKLRLLSCFQGVLEYQFDEGHNGGAAGRITMTRLISLGSDCTEADGEVTELQAEYEPTITGSWYDPEAGGQGVELYYIEEIEADEEEEIPGRPGFLFGGWFTFEPAPADAGPEGQRWFTFQGLQVDDEDGTITTTITRATGGTFDGAPAAETRRAGIAVFESVSCNELKLTYDFDDLEAIGEFRNKTGEIVLRRIGNCTPTP